MEDGAVEYIPVVYAIEHNDFNSYGNITNVSGVITLVQVSASYTNSYT